MARIHRNEHSSDRTVLLVDDDPDYTEANRSLLAAEGHRVLTAGGGEEALAILRRETVDVVLLDYFMPGMTGEEVVAELRTFNPLTQVILQTGYSSDKPAREMMHRLDVQGYCDKAEGPEKLLLWTEVGLKAAFTVQLLEKNRRGLRYILDVTPDLHKLQPLDDLLQGILWQVTGLLGAIDSFVAAGTGERSPTAAGGESLLAMLEEGDLVVHAATGRFTTGRRLDHELAGDRLIELRTALQDGSTRTGDGTSIVPLRVGERAIGVMYLDRPPVHERDAELLRLFANQAAVAIRNAQLHEMATLDSLTGVAVRRFFEQHFLVEVCDTFRGEEPLSLLLLDVDRMKRINDRYGHLAGDRALALTGQVLRHSLRGQDVAGRYGGDEFAVVLPATTREQATEVAARILATVGEQSIDTADGPLPLHCSIGIATLAAQVDWAALPRPIPPGFFQSAATTLFATADASLYQAKARRDGSHGPATEVRWPEPPDEEEEELAALQAVGA